LVSHRITGLSVEQLDALVDLVAEALPEPWNAPIGRPRELDLREAVFVVLVYERHNVTQELLAAFMDVDQATISRVITALLSVVAEVTAPFVPDEEEATEAVSGRVALVDGTLAPCWSWQERRDLFGGKHATTGHNFIVIADLDGRIRYVTDPRPGKDHDMTVLKETAAIRILAAASDVIGDKGFQGSGYVTPIKKPQGGHLTFLQEDYNNKISGLRAAIERAVAHIKNWKILHTDYRRPISTWEQAFRAAIGLYFFSQAWGSA
jgi:DDE superfamily endonuclease/Helix-turn-helix of DDE superfamily endonuclease